jgi:hypothetical protein
MAPYCYTDDSTSFSHPKTIDFVARFCGDALSNYCNNASYFTYCIKSYSKCNHFIRSPSFILRKLIFPSPLYHLTASCACHRSSDRHYRHVHGLLVLVIIMLLVVHVVVTTFLQTFVPSQNRQLTTNQPPPLAP